MKLFLMFSILRSEAATCTRSFGWSLHTRVPNNYKFLDNLYFQRVVTELFSILYGRLAVNIFFLQLIIIV